MAISVRLLIMGIIVNKPRRREAGSREDVRRCSIHHHFDFAVERERAL
jgi:hypothetical protein